LELFFFYLLLTGTVPIVVVNFCMPYILAWMNGRMAAVDEKMNEKKMENEKLKMIGPHTKGRPFCRFKK
jgi:hypothetical protein